MRRINCFFLAAALLMSLLSPAQDTVQFKKTLDSVTVQGVKPFIQNRAGKIVLNVAESPLAAGGNVTELMAHIPGVDGLQWHGRTLLVLIDGRNTGLKGGDLQTILDGMAAGTVDRIELIENPSAKYEASGGAVLNIITMKSKKQGVNGVLTTGVGAGRYLKLTEGGTLNYKKGKLNLYAGYDLLHGKPFYDYYSSRVIDSVRVLTETTEGTRKADNHSIRAGMDYSPDARRSFGVQVRGQYSIKRMQSFNRSSLDSSSTVDTRGSSAYFIPSVNAWYKYTIDSAGRELTVNADYLHYAKRWDEDLTTRYYDLKNVEYGNAGFLRDHSPAANRILSLSADYVHPVKWGKFELGFKSSFTTTDNDVRWQVFRDSVEGANEGTGGSDDGKWITDKGLTNHFVYRENINAAYMNFSRRWSKWGLDLGLRAEQTISEGYSITLDRTDRKNYISLFPNIGVQYTLSGDQELDFSYRRGIERFGFDVVNPFVRYISQYSYSQGNPAIRPSTSQNFSLSYSWRNELAASVSYQHYLDAPGTIFFRADTGAAVISTETNLGSADQLETDLSWTKGFFNGKWTSSNSVGILYAKYDLAGGAGDGGSGGAIDPGAIGAGNASGARWTAMLNTDNVFLLGKGWKAQVSGMYFSPFVLGVYSYRSRFSASVGVSKSVWHEKGKLSLNVSDLFNSMVNRFTVQSGDILSVNRQKNESRVIKLVFTYKFGGKASRNGAGHVSGIEELKQRLGQN